MYKDKEKQRTSDKERAKRYRDKKGVTWGVMEGVTQGVTILPKGVTETVQNVTPKPKGVTENQGVTKGSIFKEGTIVATLTELEINRQVLEAATHNPRVQHLAEVMTDPIRRKKLQMIVDSFAQSSRPEYSNEVYYGIGGPSIATLSTVLDITK